MKALEYKMAWGRPRYDVVQRKAQLKEHEKYKRRIQNTKATLKIEAPREFAHMKHNPKKLQKLKDEKLKVAKENRTLLRNISEIMRSPAPCHAQPKLRGAAFDPRSTRTLLPQEGARRLGPRTLHLPGRQRRDAQIRQENSEMRRRIDGQAPAVVTRASLARDFARAEAHLRTLSLLPRFPLLPETERAVFEAREKARLAKSLSDAKGLDRRHRAAAAAAAVSHEAESDGSHAGGEDAVDEEHRRPPRAATHGGTRRGAGAHSPLQASTRRAVTRTGKDATGANAGAAAAAASPHVHVRRAAHSSSWRGVSRASRGTVAAELSLFESFVGEEMPSLASQAGREAMAKRLIEEHERATAESKDEAGRADAFLGGARSGRRSRRERDSALRRAAEAAESALGTSAYGAQEEGEEEEEELAADALERMLAGESSFHEDVEGSMPSGAKRWEGEGGGRSQRVGAGRSSGKTVRWTEEETSESRGTTASPLRQTARSQQRRTMKPSVSSRLSTGRLAAQHIVSHTPATRPRA